MQSQDVTPDEIVEAHWPYDGPHSTDSLADAAAVVDRLVRYMNNAMWSVKPGGPGLYRVLGSLNAAAYGMDQLLGSLAATAKMLADDPSLYDDRRDRPAGDTATDVADQVSDARGSLAQLVHHLSSARSTASHLGHESRRSA